MTATSEIKSIPSNIEEISSRYFGSSIDTGGHIVWSDSANSLSDQMLPESFLKRYAEDSANIIRLLGLASLVQFTEAVSHINFHAGADASKSLISNIATALTFLPDEQSFSTWLVAIQQIAIAAPKETSVVCNKSRTLLSKLDAIGFHRWVSTGLTSTGSDKTRLKRYFTLEDKASLQVIELEADTVRFDAVKRILTTLPMGLWRKQIILRAAEFSHVRDTALRTSFDQSFIRVPTSYDGASGEQAERVFKAAITHIGAHIEYSERRKPKALKPIQIVIISILEDTRAEILAAQKYPGLMQLWRSLHVATAPGAIADTDPSSAAQNSACYVVADTLSSTDSLLARLSRALIDPEYEDDNPWIAKGRELFFAAGPDWKDQEEVRRIGVLLSNDIGQMRLQFNPKTYVVQPSYRDDNRGIWDFDDPSEEAKEDLDTIAASVQQDQKDELSKSPEQQQEQEVSPEQQTKTTQIESDKNKGVPICKLPEWDYLAASERSNWVTIVEYQPRTAPAKIISGILKKHIEVSEQIIKLVRQSKIGQTKRLKRQREGDRLDLDACIQQQVDRLSGQNFDSGIYETTAFSQRDLSVLVLLDISESTKYLIRGSLTSVFQLERDSTALLAEAMDGMGDPFAIHAFCSNTRKDLRYFHIKNFGNPYNDLSKSRLAGLRPGLSTRMGAALRYAGKFIEQQMTKRKLVLVVTDGEPSDIDVTDPKYLVEDSRKAILELASKGIDVFAVGLDGAGHTYLPRIFGQRNTVQIEDVESLPSRLPKLYFRLVA